MPVQDLYTRNPEDINYVYGILSHDDPIESIISKIKMILNTRQGQLLGDINFGVSIEDLIYETRINKFDLEKRIRMQINEYVSETKNYKIDPVVSFGKADGYDYSVIDIFINDTKTFGVLIK